MSCARISLPGGTAIVCSRRPKPPSCGACNMAPATQLCDGRVAAKSCDAPLCVWCAKREGELDFCPKCAQARILVEVSRWPEHLRSDFEERAALIEDGCVVTRAHSERMAFDLLKKEAPPREQLGLALKDG
jgi:hypothetical protein